MSLTHLIGTQAFLPALLAHIRSANTSIPLDPVIFQSILLCLIAGDTHLILRTPEEDVQLVVQLAVWTLSSIFDIPTRKLKLRPKTRSSATLSTSTPSVTFATTSAASLHPNLTPTTPTTEHGSNNNTISTFTNANNASTNDPNVTAFLRSLFLPTSDSDDASESQHSHHPHHPHHPHHRRGSGSSRRPYSEHYAHAQRTQSGPALVRPTPVYPKSPPPFGPSHANTDPLPGSIGYTHHPLHGSTILGHARSSSTRIESPTGFGTGNIDNPTRQGDLPHALVISNIEDASEAVQRALVGVLRDHIVVLPTNNTSTNIGTELTQSQTQHALPSAFLAIYVCPWNATSRPSVHKSLLDHFAMSTNVFVMQDVRREVRLVGFSGGGGAGRPWNTLGMGASFTGGGSYSTPGTPSPQTNMALPGLRTHTPPIHAPSPRRHVFTNTPVDAQPTSPTAAQTPVIPPVLLQSLRTALQQTHISPRIASYTRDLLSAARAHPRVDGTLVSVRAARDVEGLVRAWRVVGGDGEGAGAVVAGENHAGDEEEVKEEEGEEQEEEDSEDEELEDYRSALSHSSSSPSVSSPQSVPLLFDPVSPQSKNISRTKSPRNNTPSTHSKLAFRPKPKSKNAQIMDVQEIHVARMVPRVLSHRLSMREGGGREEVLAGAVFGAVLNGGEGVAFGGGAGRGGGQSSEGGIAGYEKDNGPASVKEVLVQILAEV